MPDAQPELRLSSLTATPGWRGPVPAEEIPAEVKDNVRLLTLNQWDQNAYFNQYVDNIRPSQAIFNVAGPWIDGAYEGSQGGLNVLAANFRIFVSPQAVADEYNGRTYSGGAVAMALPFALPLISILRPLRSLFGGHGWRSGNKEFDKQFSVQAVPRLDDRRAALLSPLIAPLASRDDWTFAFGGPSVVCVTHEPFSSTTDLQRTLDLLVQLVSLFPPEAVQQVGHAMPVMPTMPDGTPFDPDTIEKRLATMTPEEQAAFIVRMSGRQDLTEQEVADAIRRGQGHH